MHRVTHVDDLQRIPLAGPTFRPVRRPLGVTAFGVNAYTAEGVGDELVELHDETGGGSGQHEELYIVLSGRATFTVGGETHDAPVGTLLFVSPDERRGAVAAERGTTVLVVGGRPGAAGPPSPFEYWYTAQPAYDAGDYAEAYALAAPGLVDFPANGSLHYNLACYAALSGDRATALTHLRSALAGEPRASGWARTDPDLDSLRDDPLLRGLAETDPH